jgi:hypothetical protein
LFISYAQEDSYFTDWLALKLMSQGYRVWYDRIKLLGGESYPKEIDEAIKQNSYRVLGVVSRNSLNKPNPRKEWTLALNISRNEKTNFLIPLNLDGVPSHELNWMISDIVYIPFNTSWAQGLDTLLKLLEDIQTPRFTEVKTTPTTWLNTKHNLEQRTEQIWSNALPIEEIPSQLHRYQALINSASNGLSEWPHYEYGGEIWAFGPPPKAHNIPLKENGVLDWRQTNIQQLTGANIVPSLLRSSIQIELRRRGLKYHTSAKQYYFPKGLLEDDTIYFRDYTGRTTHIKVVGERSYWSKRQGTRVKYTYHLSPVMKPILLKFGRPVYLATIRLCFTDTNGNEIYGRRVNRLRKKICKDWWNHEWLTRTLGVISWLTQGRDHLELTVAENTTIKIRGTPLKYQSKLGITEEPLEQPIPTIDESGEYKQVEDEEEEEEEEWEDEYDE